MLSSQYSHKGDSGLRNKSNQIGPASDGDAECWCLYRQHFQEYALQSL